MVLNIRTWWRNNGLKYTVLLLWLMLCGVIFWNTYTTYRDDPQYYYAHRILGSWLCLSRGSAAVLNLNCTLLIFPICRSTVTILRQCHRLIHLGPFHLLFASFKRFHTACAYSIVCLAFIHFVAHILNAKHFSSNYDHIYTKVNAAAFPVPGVTGVVMMITVCCIVVASTRCVRTRHYNLFWYSHRILFFLFFSLLMIHGIKGPIRKQINTDIHTPGCNSTPPLPEYAPETESVRCDEDPKFDHISCSTWKWIMLPLLVYIFDKVYRSIRKSQTVEIAKSELVTYDVIKLDFKPSMSLKFSPGQYVYLSVPEISSLEWHPFSLCMTEKSDVFRVYIKVSGDWTGKLRDYTVTKTQADLENTRLSRLFVDGPFSSPLESIPEYPVSICIAGGIGITPFISYVQSLQYKDTHFFKCRRLYVIWVVRDQTCISVFEDEFIKLHQQCFATNVPDFFEVSFYVTSSKCLSLNDQSFIYRRTTHGRPVWRSMLGNYIKRHTRCKSGVFVCGPRGMIADVRQTVQSIPGHKHRVYFYHESF